MKEIVRNRSLVILGIAESISNVGNWITIMALYALIVFQGDGGVPESSGILLAGLGPMLLFSPVAGWLSDRADRKHLMIMSQVMAALPVIGTFFWRRKGSSACWWCWVSSWSSTARNRRMAAKRPLRQ